MDWTNSTLWPTLVPLFRAFMRTPPARRDARAIEAARLETIEVLQILDARLDSHDYVGGASLTMGDIATGCAAWRWRSHRSLPSRSLTTIALHDRLTPTVPSEQAFVGLHAAYRSLGGLVCADEGGFDGRPLLRWRDERRVVGVDWQSQTWWPGFQFDPSVLLPLPGMQALLAVLGAVFDDWTVAWWFAHPHPALDERAPAQAIAGDLPAVLRTARGDRFLARGW
jgi:hypothetical protein